MPKHGHLAHDDERRAHQLLRFCDNIGQFLMPLGILATNEDIVQPALEAIR